VAHADKEIDRLYGLPLDDFTRERNDAAKRLAKAGDADAAARIKSLPKPSLVAWTANQLARRDRDGVKRLLAAGRELRKAHRAALGGRGGDAVAEASSNEREAVASLVGSGGALLSDAGRPATPATLDKLGATLHAAAVDLEVAKALETGRLEAEAESFGFGPLLTVAPPPSATAKAAKKPEKKPKPEKQADVRARARAQIRETQQALREARNEQQRLARAVRAAEHAAEQARERVARAEEHSEAATADAEAAAARVAELERELAKLRG
jgi:hypothetical protein